MSFVRQDETTAAIELLQKLERQPIKPDVVMYNIIIDGLCKHWLVVTDAGNMFSKMIAWGITADVITYNSLIHGFCCESQLEEAT